MGSEKSNQPLQSKKLLNTCVFRSFHGGELGTRTPDPLRVMQVL